MRRDKMAAPLQGDLLSVDSSSCKTLRKPCSYAEASPQAKLTLSEGSLPGLVTQPLWPGNLLWQKL
jgi:hypothetical protein